VQANDASVAEADEAVTADQQNGSEGESADQRAAKTWTYEDMGALLDKLKQLDPARARRYDFLRSRSCSDRSSQPDLTE
jgi:hypothetical protein